MRYTKPEIEIIDVVTGTMIATSEIEIGQSKQEGTTDANKNRGVWGDLWNGM